MTQMIEKTILKARPGMRYWHETRTWNEARPHAVLGVIQHGGYNGEAEVLATYARENTARVVAAGLNHEAKRLEQMRKIESIELI
jgi:hypothetical protein